MTRLIQDKCVREKEARYGMRGLRVGEASHPGPPGSLLTRLRIARHGALTPMDTADRTDVDSEALLDELARDCCQFTIDLRASNPQRLQHLVSSVRRGGVWCRPALGRQWLI